MAVSPVATANGGFNPETLRSPDGVVFEFVERPLSYCTR